jgi:two-component system nitrate/nitrite response regulator NarL
MRIAILTPIRLIGEGVAASLSACSRGFESILVHEIAELRTLVNSDAPPRLAIIDVTQSLPLEPIRAFHSDHSDLPLIAFGLRERETDIIAHGSAGFTGYLRREDGLDELRARVEDALSGRLSCSPEIAAGIMRGLFQRGLQGTAPSPVDLTNREKDVAELVSRGLSNKEVAQVLDLSESTVKHHVHSILGKKRLGSRLQMVREAQIHWAPEAVRRARG